MTTSVRSWNGNLARMVLIAGFLLPLSRNPASSHGLRRDFVRLTQQIREVLDRSLKVAH